MIRRAKEIAIFSIMFQLVVLVFIPMPKAEADDECTTPITCNFPGGPNWCELFQEGTHYFRADSILRPDDMVTPISVWIVNFPGGAPDLELPLTYRIGYCEDPINDPVNVCNDPMADLQKKLKYVKIIRNIVDKTDANNPIILKTEKVKYKKENLESNKFFSIFGEAFYADPNEAALDPFSPLPTLLFLPVLDVEPVKAQLRRQGRVIVHEDLVFWGVSSEHCDGVPALFDEPLEWHCIPNPDFGDVGNEAFLGFKEYVVEPCPDEFDD